MILAQHVNAISITCINDPYDIVKSVKDDEHQLSIQDQGPIPNVHEKQLTHFLQPANLRQLSVVLAIRNDSRLSSELNCQKGQIP